MRPASERSWLRRGLRAAITMGAMAALLLVPAGRLDWYPAWAFLIAFFTSTGCLALWMSRRDPALVRERTRVADNVEPWDQVLMAVYTVFLVAMLVLAGLDAGRFGWSKVPVVVRALACIGLGAAMLLIWRVMEANTFLSERVRIQEERGHRVITTGPYRYVRHPMYVGVILSMCCIPIVLGSWYALILGGTIGILFVLRTALEDRTLIHKLSGYLAYAQNVRFRLIPGIW